MTILNNEQEIIGRVVNNKLLLGIGRQYSASEKKSSVNLQKIMDIVLQRAMQGYILRYHKIIIERRL